MLVAVVSQFYKSIPQLLRRVSILLIFVQTIGIYNSTAGAAGWSQEVPPILSVKRSLNLI